MEISGKQLFLFLIIFTFTSVAQDKKNLEIFYSLIDSSINILPSEIPGNTGFSVSTGSNKLLYNYIYKKLAFKYNSSKEQKEYFLSYVIEETGLKYGEIFRQSFLGGYYLERSLHISGSYVLKGMPGGKDFFYTFVDTVKLEDIKNLENPDYPFTQDNIPPEPFFSSIPEPFIAIGTAAAAVILFFVLRSK